MNKDRIIGYTTKHLKFISTGLCPDCIECAELFGVSIDELNQGIETGNLFDEGSFSWDPCDDCNTSLGGNSFIAHGVDSNNDIVHFYICYDCLLEWNGYTLDEDGDYIG